MTEKGLSHWIENHPLASLVYCSVGTAIFLLAIGVPLHNLVVEQKDAKVEVVQEQLKLYGARLVVKDEQIADYVSKLQDREVNATSRSLLSNSKLKTETIATVSGIRTLLADYQRKSSEITYSRFNDFKNMSEEERNRQWNEDNKKSSELLNQVQLNYNAKHKINAILLRDELLSRLPKDINRNTKKTFYEHAITTHGIMEVADDLERLAKLLPTGKEKNP